MTVPTLQVWSSDTETTRSLVKETNKSLMPIVWLFQTCFGFKDSFSLVKSLGFDENRNIQQAFAIAASEAAYSLKSQTMMVESLLAVMR